LKYYVVITLFIISFFTACQISSDPQTKSSSQNKIYFSAQACDLNKSIAKDNALKALKEKSHLNLITEFSTSILKQEDGLFCYEVSVSRKEWGKYNQSLVKRRQQILQETQEQNSTRFFSEKSVWIKTLVEKRRDFNHELLAAKAIAPVLSSPLDVNATRLAKTLNTKPSVKMDYKPCKNRSNYKCQLGFVSNASDEDSRLIYDWDFGDGRRSVHKNPLYTYTKEGEYTVTLKVTDTEGVYSRLSTVIKVVKSLKPFVQFSTKKHVYKTGEPIVFVNHSYTQESKIKTYHWTFGDALSSSKRSPSHTYVKEGKYLVSLKVCNKNKYCSRASKQILIKKGKALIDVKQGTRIEDYMAKEGIPSQEIVKQKALMTAYKYGDIWLLCKRGKIECAIKDEGLTTNLLGQPKKCYWHEKHAKKYMVELK